MTIALGKVTIDKNDFFVYYGWLVTEDRFIFVVGLSITTWYHYVVKIEYSFWDFKKHWLNVWGNWSFDFLCTILFGYFNETRIPLNRELRFNFSYWNPSFFNESILMNPNLYKLHAEGRCFTLMSKENAKMIKIHIFLVSCECESIFPNMSLVALAKLYTEHRPLM